MRLCKFVLAVGVLALVCAPVMAQGRGGRGRGGIGTLSQNKSVQEELKVKEDAAKQLKEAYDKVREDNKDDLAKLRDQNTTPEDRQAITKKVNEAYAKSFKDILSADQLKRLNQIVLQQEGLRMYQNEQVLSAVKLTDEQKTKLKDIADNYRKEMTALRPPQGTRPSDDDRAKMTALTKETTGKAKDVLTGDQKKSLEDLLGKPFEVKFEAPAGGNRNRNRNRTNNN